MDEEVEDAEEEEAQPILNQEALLINAKGFFNANKEKIGESAKKSNRVVKIDFQDLVEHSPELADNLISKPEDTLQILELALEDSGIVHNPRVRMENLSEADEIGIRNIRAKHLGMMISIEGIVRQASEVRPQVVNAKFECPSCGTIISVLQIDKKFREPMFLWSARRF